MASRFRARMSATQQDLYALRRVSEFSGNRMSVCMTAGRSINPHACVSSSLSTSWRMRWEGHEQAESEQHDHRGSFGRLPTIPLGNGARASFLSWESVFPFLSETEYLGPVDNFKFLLLTYFSLQGPISSRTSCFLKLGHRQISHVDTQDGMLMRWK